MFEIKFKFRRFWLISLTAVFLAGIYHFTPLFSAESTAHIHDSKCTHSEVEEHDDHEQESSLKFTPAQLQQLELRISTATAGQFNTVISAPGEIVPSSDLLRYHVLRTAGIADQIIADIGDYVSEGDLLAIIDSAELGSIKTDYYQLFNQHHLLTIQLQRATQIDENISELLNLLTQEPEFDKLPRFTDAGSGSYQARLISSWAEYTSQKRILNSQRQLYSRKVLSEIEFLLAQADFEKARAEYLSEIDNSRYQIAAERQAAQRDFQTNQFSLLAAERNLAIAGLTAEEISIIRNHGSDIVKQCLDSACHKQSEQSIHFHPANSDDFSKISIRAEIDGTIIDRQLEPGAYVNESQTIFTIADISMLWAILKVPERDLSFVKPNQEVILTSSEGNQLRGVVRLIEPVLDSRTRTARVRVSFYNEGQSFSVGSFTTGKFLAPSNVYPVVIPSQAIQNLDGHELVFVPGDSPGEFNPRIVTSGRRDSTQVEIVSGLSVGEKFVSHGAFSLKSVIATSGLDPHAGCGGH